MRRLFRVFPSPSEAYSRSISARTQGLRFFRVHSESWPRGRSAVGSRWARPGLTGHGAGGDGRVGRPRLGRMPGTAGLGQPHGHRLARTDSDGLGRTELPAGWPRGGWPGIARWLHSMASWGVRVGPLQEPCPDMQCPSVRPPPVPFRLSVCPSNCPSARPPARPSVRHGTGPPYVLFSLSTCHFSVPTGPKP